MEGLLHEIGLIYTIKCRPSFSEKGSLKKLRRQLQRKRQIKIELYVKLSVLRLFQLSWSGCTK